MPNKHYFFALIPLAAVWAYAVSQSAGRMFDLVTDPPRRGVERAARSAAAIAQAAAIPASAGAPARPTAKRAIADPAAEDEDIVGFEFLPRGASQSGADVSYDARAGAAPLEHPDITDPRMRALLQPAWDD